jgi:hypothetical protein
MLIDLALRSWDSESTMVAINVMDSWLTLTSVCQNWLQHHQFDTHWSTAIDKRRISLWLGKWITSGLFPFSPPYANEIYWPLANGHFIYGAPPFCIYLCRNSLLCLAWVELLLPFANECTLIPFLIVYVNLDATLIRGRDVLHIFIATNNKWKGPFGYIRSQWVVCPHIFCFTKSPAWLAS